jgi:hypothetical protein
MTDIYSPLPTEVEIDPEIKPVDPVSGRLGDEYNYTARERKEGRLKDMFRSAASRTVGQPRSKCQTHARAATGLQIELRIAS